jgi:hypothetical protein
MYLLNAYPVDKETDGSSPIGVSKTAEEVCPIPMQVPTVLVKANVFGQPACARRIRDMVPKLRVSSHIIKYKGNGKSELRKQSPSNSSMPWLKSIFHALCTTVVTVVASIW